jgi:hypothetical protein
MHDNSDVVLEEFVSNAFRRFNANLEAALPRSTPKLREFLRRVPTRPEHVVYARGFPHIVLPYWLSPTRQRVLDAEFQTDVIYSSISGYYSIRLCDNIADNDCPPELRKLAPCTLYFDSEAIRAYMKHFPANHEFWSLLDTFLAQQADASAADSLLDDVDAETFASLSSRKFTGTKIPLAAVCFRYPELESSFEQGMSFVDSLGNLAQFSNDFFDWRHDSKFGIVTYVSSEFRRRATSEESIATWFIREGFDWAANELKLRFENARLHADALGNAALLEWLISRGRTLDEDIDKLRSALNLLKMVGEGTIRSTT